MSRVQMHWLAAQMRLRKFMLLIVAIAAVGLGLVSIGVCPAEAQTVFNFDSTQLRAIKVDGVNLFVGGGAYIIGSYDGRDIPETNFGSVGATQGRLKSSKGNLGAPYSLSFWRKSDSTLGFIAKVGPADHYYAQISMPWDWKKELMSNWRVNASRVYFQCTGQDGWRNLNSGSFSSIPSACPITGEDGTFYGRVGVAMTKQATSWVTISGSLAQVRMNILSSSHFTSLNVTNHPFTNNIGLDFSPLKQGETARVEGEIIISPTTPQPMVFEAERDFQHQCGTYDGDGWGIRVTDPNGFYLFGPYTESVRAGSRTATWRILVDNVTADNNKIQTLDVRDAVSGKILAVADLRRGQFLSPWVYQDFSLNFVASAGQKLEFRAYYWGSSYTRIDKVTIR